MRLPRVTISRLMILVLLAALGLWAGLRGHEVSLNPDYHIHVLALWLDDGPAMIFQGAASPPFWPRYWRHLLGLPWKGQPLCGKIPGHFEEACSFAHPEMLQSQGAPGMPMAYSKEIDEVYARMMKHWERRYSPGWSPEAMPN